MNERLINVLVLGVGGNVSQGIIKSLRRMNYRIRIVGACISRHSVGLYMCDSSYVCPYADAPDFIDWYIDVCNREHIDIVFTGVEENIDVLLNKKDYIVNRCKAVFIYPDYLSWQIGKDKFSTCDWLKQNGCQYPAFAKLDDRQAIDNLIDNVDYPYIAKPRNGKGSQGIYLIKNKNDLDKVRDLNNYVLEECVGTDEDEYTVGCYCDKHGKLVDMIIMRRILKNGTTSMCEVVKNKIIEKEVEKICEKLHPVGPVNFQMRVEGERAVCFEMNVRYSGTTAMRNYFGFRDVEAGIKEYLFDEDISNCFQVEMGSAIRFDDEMYFKGSLKELLDGVN